MKRTVLIFLLFTLLGRVMAFTPNDFILLRDGGEMNVKVKMVNGDKTFYIKGRTEETIPNNLIYMIKYGKRGNVFFTENGERITGTGTGRIPYGATVIYLLEGKEVTGYNLVMDINKVSFTESRNTSSQINYIAKNQIFLIRYPDGTKDIINDFETVRKTREAFEEQEKKLAEEKQRLAEATRLPRGVTIKTVKGVIIKAVLQSEENDYVTYKKAGDENSPLYNMEKTNIEEITNDK